MGKLENIDTSKRVFCKLGISGKDSVGCARVVFLMNEILLEISVPIIDEYLPITLSLADMDELSIYFNNLSNDVIHQSSQEKTTVKRFYGHPFVHWDPLQQSFFTYTELKRLHKRFSHPHVDKLYNLLKCADMDNVGSDRRATLEEITQKCKPC